MNKVIKSHLAAFVILLFIIPFRSYGETLYGLSKSGVLYEVNQSNAFCTALRSALPSGQYAGLLAVNGKFYTFDITTGRYYQFGLTNGDESLLGINNTSELGGMGIRPTDGQAFIGVGDYIAKLNLNNGSTTNLVDVTGPQGQSIGRIMSISFKPDGTNYVATWGRQDSGWTSLSWNVNLLNGVIPSDSSAYHGCCDRIQSIAIGQQGEGIFLASGIAVAGTQPPWFYFYNRLRKYENDEFVFVETFTHGTELFTGITALAFNIQTDLVGPIPNEQYYRIGDTVVYF